VPGLWRGGGVGDASQTRARRMSAWLNAAPRKLRPDVTPFEGNPDMTRTFSFQQGHGNKLFAKISPRFDSAQCRFYLRI
jgi:hypothetical protein